MIGALVHQQIGVLVTTGENLEIFIVISIDIPFKFHSRPMHLAICERVPTCVSL